MRKTLTLATAATLITLLAAILSGPGCQGEGTDGKIEIPPVSAMPIETDGMGDAHKQLAQTMISDGLRFLLSQQEDNGGWRTSTPVGAAYTGMVVKALLGHPDFTTATPAVKRGLDYMLTFRQDNGGIYDPKGIDPEKLVAKYFSSQSYCKITVFLLLPDQPTKP